MNFDPIKDLLYRLADDDLVTGHRMSEWTGFGPILEEDIAFSSMAQDEVGHARAYYTLMNEWMGEPSPDAVAFNRPADQFRNATLVELPIGDYAFSLVRHFLYDVAESIRLDHLSRSDFKPLAELAKKLSREEKYHVLHGETWVRQLGRATDEANQRMQSALNEAYPVAFGLFEPTDFSAQLAQDNVLPTEEALEAEWQHRVEGLVKASGLSLPKVSDKTAHYGGRKGQHTEHLAAMVAEMSEVFAIDPLASW